MTWSHATWRPSGAEIARDDLPAAFDRSIDGAVTGRTVVRSGR